MAAFVGECEILYGLKITYKNQVKMKHVKKLRKKLYALKEAEGIEFVMGRGGGKARCRKTWRRWRHICDKLKVNKANLCNLTKNLFR